jgi:hypothetical protein
VVELALAVWTGVVSLFADAVHMLVDAGGILLSLVAIWFAERPADVKKNVRYYRVEILAALVNGVVLCVVALGFSGRPGIACGRPRTCPRRRSSRPRALGLGVNLRPLRLLHAGARTMSLNIRAAYLEVLGDALSSGRRARGRRASIALTAGARPTRWPPPAIGPAHPAAHVAVTPHHARQSCCWRPCPAHLDLAGDRGGHVPRGPECGACTTSTCGRSPRGREAMSAHVNVEPGTRG